jgi:hypothetical protein
MNIPRRNKLMEELLWNLGGSRSKVKKKTP